MIDTIAGQASLCSPVASAIAGAEVPQYNFKTWFMVFAPAAPGPYT